MANFVGGLKTPSSTLLFPSKMFHKKQIFKLNVLRKLLTDENSCVSLASTTRLLALPPFFLNDMKSGILYILNAMLKKYDRALGGIVIGYQNIKVLMDENTGIIPIGTSETEVNISVEFYIFQPKIGNYLEGVINKKSNNHIGCLVHQYFNATILKPEDIDYDDWICKDFSVDDKITFRVKDLDFTTLLPYIEGVVDDKNSVKKIKKNVNCNVDNVIMNNINESSENESLFSKSVDKEFKSEFLGNKKAKNKNEEEVSLLEYSINTSSREFKSFPSPKKKKKKKEKIDLEFDDQCKREEERSSKDKKLTTASCNNEFKPEESNFKKKKKKKEKNKHDNDEQCLTAVKNSTKEEDPITSFLEKRLQLENENSNDFVKERKSSKVKKKKKNKDEEISFDFNKTSACLPAEEVEDNMFYSTQLEPISEGRKMKMPTFSPILPLSKKVKSEMTTQNLDLSAQLNHEKESQEKEKKKKQKKRKRDERDESAGEHAPKKVKTSHISNKKAAQAEVNGTEIKSDTQIMMEEMYKKLLNEAKEQLNVSDKESSKVKKKKKESKKREKKAAQSELSKNSITQVNGSEGKSGVQSILDKLLEDEMKRVQENLNASDREKNKSHEKTKADKQEKKLLKEKAKNGSFKVKKHSKTSLSDINGEGKKFEVH